MLLESRLDTSILFINDRQRLHCKAEGVGVAEYLLAPLVAALRRAGIYSQDYAFITQNESSDEEFRVAIMNHQANILVPLGEQMLQLITGERGIDKWQLSIIPATAEYGGRKCMPLYSPEHVQKIYSDHAFYSVAAHKLAQQRQVPTITTPQRKFVLAQDFKTAADYLIKKVIPAKVIALDWEFSRGLINTVGFAISATEAIAIRVSPDLYTEEDHFNLWKLIAKVCEGPAKKIVQHCMVESTWMARYGIQMENVYHDTMWAAKFLNPEFDKGLDNVGRLYTPYPYWKDDNDSWSNIRDWSRHLDYNCKDTTGTFAAYLSQQRELRDRGLTELFYGFIMQFEGPVREMCVTGLNVDPEMLLNVRNKLNRQQENYLRIIDDECIKAIGKTINVRSHKQLHTVLKAMGMKLPTKKSKKTNESNDTTDRKALAKLRRQNHDASIIPALIGISATNKQLSSYTEFSYDTVKSKVHYNIDANGTETGRWCIRKSTKISLAGEEKCIEDVKVGDLAYCYDAGKNLQLKKVIWSGKTGHKNLIRLHWKSMQGRIGYLDITPEHKVRMLDGSYKCGFDIKSGDRALALHRYVDDGYIKLIGRNKKTREHVFIYNYHHGHIPEIVHHIDGDKLNNSIENLMGTSRSEHVREHALADGRKPNQPSYEQRARGSKIASAILTEDKVLDIKTLLASGQSQASVAGMFGVSKGCIGCIASGRNWKHVQLNNHIITAVEHLKLSDDVYDLEIEDCHNFIANEICVHNSGYLSAWGTGFNPQTVPPSAKGIFVADPGTVLLEIDLEKAESWYVALDSPEPRLIEMLESGGDIHKYVAAGILNKPQDFITKQERQLGKKVGHASNYGTGPRTFAEQVLSDMGQYLTEQEAKKMLEGYFEVFPNIRKRQARIRGEIYQHRYLKTPTGRERYFFGRTNDATYREAYAYQPQSTIPDITNHLMLALWRDRDALGLGWEEGGRFLLQVHDSLLLQCDPGRASEIANFAKSLDWHPKITLAGGKLRIPVSVKMGKRWKGMENV